MNLSGLRYVDRPREPFWELPGHPLGPSGAFGLLGWELKKAPVDMEMDTDAGRILLKCLCARGTVAFPRSKEASTIRSSLPRQASAESWDFSWELPAQAKHPFGSVEWVVATRLPEQALRLFDDPVYSWHDRAQWIAVLPSILEPDSVDGRRLATVAQWARGQVVGDALEETPPWEVLVVPAVDGDFAGMFFKDRKSEADLLGRLEASCAEQSLRWRVCSEEDFQSEPWIRSGSNGT